jgi:ABC-type transport system involved in cytochrome bd biosynthesis fused ATPase/permease subunit
MVAIGIVAKKAMGAKFAQNAKLGAHTEESFAALRLIFSFAQEDMTLKEYDKIAEETCVIARKAATV